MHDPVALHFYIKTSLTLLAAVGILAPCFWFAIGPKVPRPIPIENFIAFNLTVFIVMGLRRHHRRGGPLACRLHMGRRGHALRRSHRCALRHPYRDGRA